MYLFLAIVGALILILILAQLRKPKPKKRVIKTTPVLKRRPPETHFREELVLSPRESRALERLSWCLKDPKNKDQLLENQALFLRAARRALREGMVTEAELFRLTERMGVNLNTLRANRH
ncbi:MAG: hypothetical protein ACLFPW_09740, partial [Spirochaetaceae bacterium]